MTAEGAGPSWASPQAGGDEASRYWERRRRRARDIRAGHHVGHQRVVSSSISKQRYLTVTSSVPTCETGRGVLGWGIERVGLIWFSGRRRHTRWTGDWSSDVCSSD